MALVNDANDAKRHLSAVSLLLCHRRNSYQIRARFLSLARSKLRLFSTNYMTGYFSNLACGWLSIVWAYSEQEKENGPDAPLTRLKKCCCCALPSVKGQVEFVKLKKRPTVLLGMKQCVFAWLCSFIVFKLFVLRNKQVYLHSHTRRISGYYGFKKKPFTTCRINCVNTITKKTEWIVLKFDTHE